MSNKLTSSYASGATITCVVRMTETGTSVGTPTITETPADSGYYVGTFPAIAAGVYDVQYYEGVDLIGGSRRYWSGTDFLDVPIDRTGLPTASENAAAVRDALIQNISPITIVAADGAPASAEGVYYIASLDEDGHYNYLLPNTSWRLYQTADGFSIYNNDPEDPDAYPKEWRSSTITGTYIGEGVGGSFEASQSPMLGKIGIVGIGVLGVSENGFALPTSSDNAFETKSAILANGTKLDGDKLNATAAKVDENLDAKVSEVGGGSIDGPCTLTITVSAGTLVSLTTGDGLSDAKLSNGAVVYAVQPATPYTVSAIKSGFSMGTLTSTTGTVSGNTITVTGNSTATLAMDPITIPTPASLTYCNVALTVRNAAGEPLPESDVVFSLSVVPTNSSGNLYIGQTVTQTSDDNGLVVAALLRNSKWIVSKAGGTHKHDIVVPDAATYTPPDMVLRS